MSNITELLSRIEAGEASLTADLFPLVYDELRQLARRISNEEGLASRGDTILLLSGFSNDSRENMPSLAILKV